VTNEVVKAQFEGRMALFARYLIEAGLADEVKLPGIEEGESEPAPPHSLTADDILWLLDALQGQLALLRALLERASRPEGQGPAAGNPHFVMHRLREIMIGRQQDGRES
jgi:hypothetical protein